MDLTPRDADGDKTVARVLTETLDGYPHIFISNTLVTLGVA